MYAFPQIFFSEKAKLAASANNMEVDTFYCYEIL